MFADQCRKESCAELATVILIEDPLQGLGALWVVLGIKLEDLVVDKAC